MNLSAGPKNSTHSFLCVSGSIRRGRNKPLSHVPSFLPLSLPTQFSSSAFPSVATSLYFLPPLSPVSFIHPFPNFHRKLTPLWDWVPPLLSILPTITFQPSVCKCTWTEYSSLMSLPTRLHKCCIMLNAHCQG